MNLLAEAFSDQKWSIYTVLAEGDQVLVYCTQSGRHTGDLFGLPATGNSFSYEQMHLVRILDGKAVEHTAVRDDASLWRQLRAEVPAPAGG
jgi:predicted ester cyclase